MNVVGKKLLVLGGTVASLNIVNLAKAMGIYTIVTDEKEVSERVAKRSADEYAMISTTDMDRLSKLIKERGIDGVFCGPSEFNIRNMIKLCELNGLPCYTTMEQWNHCANKDEFTACCRKFGVDVPEEYELSAIMTENQLETIDYPIIVKPVDGCSSIGISVCRDKSEVRAAYQKAMDASTCKRIIAEKYIENGGEIFGARYLVQDGEAYPYLLIDTYVADPINRTSLISAYTQTPSKYSKYYMEHMDSNVRAMIKGMGIKSGTVFFQSLPYKGKIYFHEMGYRLSGGMIYKLTEPLMGINDMKMMIRSALGGECITLEEIKKIDLSCSGKVGAQLMIPLSCGIIAKISGLEGILKKEYVIDFLQYYDVGDEILPSVVGTLGQHFGRFTLKADNEEEMLSIINEIQKLLLIEDINGNDLYTMKFDTKRVSLQRNGTRTSIQDEQ
ncbi:MAG: ATP-grasp domain-containing protein [Clostridiales bacterium]|jgi:hypothetical protein|nr:ATP-grasp domain-containing protein [Clostridiales bacterium]